MSNYVKLATDAGDQYLSNLADAQENFLKATTAFASKFPQPAPVEAPPAFAAAAAQIPTVQEMTEASFAFATKLLKQQKSFAEKFWAASTPAK